MKKKPVQAKLIHEMAVNNVYNAICNGNTISNIIQDLTNDNYGIGKKYCLQSAYNIINKVKNIIKHDFEDYKPQLRANLFITLMDILGEAREEGDRANALKAIDYIAKLGGVYEQNINLNDNKVIDINFNFDN